MIRAVFFDLYGTLVRFEPPPEAIQAGTLHQLGLEASIQGLRQGYAKADDFMARENARDPIFQRASTDRDAFFTEYERLILRTAGIEADEGLAFQVWERVRQTPRELALFEDALPALQALKGRELVLGLISNLDRDVGELTRRLHIDRYLDFWVTSQEVGRNKPHPDIFFEALRQAKVAAPEALHVGDQYHSDVRGALAAGIHPLLLDRTGLAPDQPDCPEIHSLRQVVRYLDGLPANKSLDPERDD